MFGWSENARANVNQLKIIRRISNLGKNIVLAKFNDHEAWKEERHQRIDIWWGGRDNNGDLMLILAYMLKLNAVWEDADIDIHAVVNNSIEAEKLRDGIERSINEVRIPAKVDVLIKKENRSFPELLKERSAGADIVFMGLRKPERGREKEQMEKIKELSQVGKVVVFAENNSMEETFPILFEKADGTQFS
jgi:hypothetical protein